MPNGDLDEVVPLTRGDVLELMRQAVEKSYPLAAAMTLEQVAKSIEDAKFTCNSDVAAYGVLAARDAIVAAVREKAAKLRAETGLPVE